MLAPITTTAFPAPNPESEDADPQEDTGASESRPEAESPSEPTPGPTVEEGVTATPAADTPGRTVPVTPEPAAAGSEAQDALTLDLARRIAVETREDILDAIRIDAVEVADARTRQAETALEILRDAGEPEAAQLDTTL
ncbi:hypothetical protein [Jannaschia ovalis]|uniref:Uncharacterized protein n=1 Tax=Jannaschia ovalis TaxID=3038773 RepID=A0ABY8L906_9RHOB|nr:hypothetical protein [Jannaschia sp. GRR-S6-38]WGH77842.1 hypothetical protein P8627_12470 [Jannaschia sp. GRR-S6-38]